MIGTVAIVSLGANLGDRAGTLRSAVARLQRSGVELLGISSLYETEPVGYADQPDFLNGVAAFLVPAEISATRFLKQLLAVEHELGRVRTFRNAPRTCDLDLIFFGKENTSSSELVLPHPRWKERLFVLVPLAELLSGGAVWSLVLPWPTVLSESKTLIPEISGKRPEKSAQQF